MRPVKLSIPQECIIFHVTSDSTEYIEKSCKSYHQVETKDRWSDLVLMNVALFPTMMKER